MNAWKLSLRGIQHPFTIAAIGLLLFNDHVLKSAAPSFWTGKLSDLAGLFFFPFLLTAILAAGLGLLRRDVPPLRVFFAALLITLFSFAAIKTIPPLNAMVSHALGVQIVRDPTDLLALSVLPAAGLLAVRLARPPATALSRRKPSTLAYLMLAVASLATAATSPCLTARVEQTQVYENAIYLNVPGSYEGAQVYSSSDGLTWTLTEKVPTGVQAALANKPVLPKMVCGTQNPRLCYRISGSDLIEESTDGGQTWVAAWQIPAGREAYMLRKPPLSCKTRTDIQVLDLAVLQPDAATTIVVGAMGEEGVVVKAADGSWQRVAVSYASPTPMSAGDIFSALAIMPFEFILSILIALVAFWAVNVWGWRRLTRDERFAPEERKAARQPAWLALGLLLAAGITLLVVGVDGRIDGAAWFVIVGIFCLLFAVWVLPFLTWGRVTRLYKKHNLPARLPRRAAWLCAALLLPLPGVFLNFWALGVIAHYWLAALLGVGGGFLLLVLVILGIRAIKTPA